MKGDEAVEVGEKVPEVILLNYIWNA